MIKSLLRTLPSLSGNMQLCCILDNEYKKLRRTSYQRVSKGYLIPLHNDYYNNKIYVNLKEDSHEWIVKKYYDLYYNMFYQFTYDDTKEYSENINRNIYFEYGCSRYFNKVVNKDFIFFAPLYIDNVNDIPTHFLIDISIKGDDKILHQYIKVDLTQSTTDYTNPLGDYLYRYINKIDSKCIYINSESKGAIYEGIDLVNGGFASKEYLGLSKYINNHYPVNDFNTVINKGYESNCLMMKQIIPLSFAFNLSDYGINDYDVVRVKGNYYNNNILLPLYDFDIRYDEDIFDIANAKFPALGENSLYANKETNKINITGNKWKLYESNVDTPYITNNNYAYSDINSHKYKYDKTNIEDRLDYINIGANHLCEDNYDNITGIYTNTKVTFIPSNQQFQEIESIENYIDLTELYNNYKITKRYINDDIGIHIVTQNKLDSSDRKIYNILYSKTKKDLQIISNTFFNTLNYYINKYKTSNLSTHLQNINNCEYAYSTEYDITTRKFTCKYKSDKYSLIYNILYDITTYETESINLYYVISNLIANSFSLFFNNSCSINSIDLSTLNTSIKISTDIDEQYIELNISDYIYTKETSTYKYDFTDEDILNKDSYFYNILDNLHLQNNFYNSSLYNNCLKYNWYKTSINKEVYMDDLFIIQVPNANYFNIFICELNLMNVEIMDDYITHHIDKLYDHNNDLVLYEYYIIYHDKRNEYGDIFNFLQHNIDYIVNQTNNYLQILYKTTKNVNNNEWYLSKLKNKMYFYLQRYFRNICPIFIQNNTIDIYYRDDTNTMCYNTYNVNFIEGDDTIDNFIEYKYFNSSKCLNLPHSIKLDCPVQMYEDDISTYETETYVYNIFKSYCERCIKKEIVDETLSEADTETTIKYIFNLYQYYFDKTKIDDKNKIYKLKYKFLIK